MVIMLCDVICRESYLKEIINGWLVRQSLCNVMHIITILWQMLCILNNYEVIDN